MDQSENQWASLAVAVIVTLCLFWGSDRIADRLLQRGNTTTTFSKWFPSSKAESVHTADTAITVLRARDPNGELCGYTVTVTDETLLVCVAVSPDTKTIYGITIHTQMPLMTCQDRVNNALDKAYTYIQTISF